MKKIDMQTVFACHHLNPESLILIVFLLIYRGKSIIRSLKMPSDPDEQVVSESILQKAGIRPAVGMTNFSSVRGFVRFPDNGCFWFIFLLLSSLRQT